MFHIQNESDWLSAGLIGACTMAETARAEFVTPEHLLYQFSMQPPFLEAVEMGYDLTDILEKHLIEHTLSVPDHLPYNADVGPSMQLQQAIVTAYNQYSSSEATEIHPYHIIAGMMALADSPARQLLQQVNEAMDGELLSALIEAYDKDGEIEDVDSDEEDPLLDEAADAPQRQKNSDWKQYVSCLNELAATHNPLIGREQELRRTIQVLCRKDKNNPLHVGEAGVGKTALAYGLAAMVERGEVPERLKGARIYSLEIGTLMAGTQYRGDMEKRFKTILDGAEAEQGAIVYIDEIHQLIGAGRTDGGGLDAANMVKPYLERGSLRFMGATTYDEYNRYIVRSKAFARRFEKIDVAEPSTDECQQILEGLKDRYEAFHQVTYSPEAIAYAVKASAKYITDRHLPDKAIDLIDDAGASVNVSKTVGDDNTETLTVITPEIISHVLAGICHVETLAEDTTDTDKLLRLADSLRQQVYGQDEAIEQVTEAVLMGSAGLLAEGKPMASLLFVGPTGVGKTEVARVLAKQLDLPLVRFDMSEYAEKHTVAKLIGAPAGYVGYDDGGLLTDAIRRTPHCVLLLDEIEKAHQDIYNILLQVMDYAVLTDSKGQKADFRHVVLILTTNAGAQYARQASPGFVKTTTAGEAMLKSVRKTFKPEFLNRLTAVTVFHDIDRHMAELILDKKLGELQALLTAKSIELELRPAARTQLLQEGFSAEYGGREIERVINARIKPLLTRAILFGPLKEGGKATVDYTCKAFTIV